MGNVPQGGLGAVGQHAGVMLAGCRAVTQPIEPRVPQQQLQPQPEGIGGVGWHLRQQVLAELLHLGPAPFAVGQFDGGVALLLNLR